MKTAFRSRWGIVVISVASLIVIIVLQKTALLSPVERGATYIFAPVQRILWHAGDQLKSVFGYFQKNSELRRENDSLRSQLTSLATENVSLQKKIESLGSIADQYDIVTSKNLPAVTGQIIGRSSDEYSHVILINKGVSAGVQPGYPVITNGGVLVGTIVSVAGEISKIQLLTDNHSQINAMVQNQDNSPGIINGQFALSLVMDFIPQNHILTTGQLVLSSGLDEYIPSSLLIGTITEITKKEGELFQTATVEPAINYQQLDIVTILLPTNG